MSEWMHGMLHRNTDAVCRVEESTFRFAHGSHSRVKARGKGVSSVFIDSDFVLHSPKWIVIRNIRFRGGWDAFFMMIIVADNGSIDFQVRCAICLGFLGLPFPMVVTNTVIEQLVHSKSGRAFTLKSRRQKDARRVFDLKGNKVNNSLKYMDIWGINVGRWRLWTVVLPPPAFTGKTKQEGIRGNEL